MEGGRQFYRAEEVWIHQRNNFLSPFLLSKPGFMCMNCQSYELFLFCGITVQPHSRKPGETIYEILEISKRNLGETIYKILKISTRNFTVTSVATCD